MQLLKVSTTASIVVGPVLDSTGAEYTSAVIGDISLSKNGGTLTALAATATLTYIANGHYTLALTTGNTDTLGRADILCNKAGYQLPPVRLTVLAATPFDTLITNGTLASTTSGRTLDVSAGGEAGIDWANVGSPTTTLALTGTTIATTQKVDLETIKTNPVVNAGTVTFPTTATLASTTNITAGTITTVTTTTTATNVTTVNGLASGVITAASIAADAITAAKIADGAIDTATFATGTTIPRVTLADTVTTYTGNTPQTGDSYALANSGTIGLAAIKGYVDDIGVAGAGLTALGDTRIANLDAAVSSRLASSGGSLSLTSLTVSGATTLTGNVSLAAGLTITQSTADTPAVSITGNGVGDGIRATGGSGNGCGMLLLGTASGAGLSVLGGLTGAGASLSGGVTSGNGLNVQTTSGHGINVLAAGASKHGVLITGGDSGTCDGLKAVAGTGGVPIRGNITGNLTGNVTGSVGSVSGAVGSVTGNVGGNVTGSAGSVVGAVGSVTGNVGGNVTGSVGSVVGAVGSVTGNVGGMTASGWATAFTTDTTKAFADAVEGSLVKEVADGVASGGGTVDANIVSVNGTTFVGSNVHAILADGVAHGGTPGSSTATMALKNLNVTATGFDDAVQVSGGGAAFNINSGNGTDCVIISSAATGISISAGAAPAVYLHGGSTGLLVTSGDSGLPAVQLGDGSSGAEGLLALGGVNGSPGASFTGKTGGAGVLATGGTSGSGAKLVGGSSSGSGLTVVATAGNGAVIQGGDQGSGGIGLKILPGENTSEAALQLGDGTSGAEGVKVLAGIGNTDADGVTATGAGTGVGFRSTPDAVGFGGGGTFPANFSALVIDASGRVLTDRVAFSGTLGDQSLGDVNNVVLPTGPASNGVLVSARLRIYSGAGQYQERTIIVWDASIKLATVDRAWFGVAPASGDLFHVLYDNAIALDPSGNVPADAHVSTIGPTALGQFFTLNSGQTYADAVAGSVVKETALNVDAPSASTIAAAVRDVDNSTPAGGSLGLACRGADAKAAVLIDTVGTPATTTVSADIAAVSAKTGNLPTSPAAVGSAMTLAAGAVTEASIAQPTETAGRPTGLLAKLQRLFEWGSNKRTRNKTTGVVTLRDENDATTLESQTQSTVEPVDTQSKGV